METRRLAIRAVVASLLLVPFAGPADAGPRESFSVNVFQADNRRLPGGQTCTVLVNVDAWATPEEGKRLRTTLAEKGPGALLGALSGQRAGFLTPSPIGCVPFFTEPSMPPWRVTVLHAVRADTTERGRRIQILTRPWPLSTLGGGGRNQFWVLDLTFDAKGHGQGRLVTSAEFRFSADGGFDWRPAPEAPAPLRLAGVAAWSVTK